MFVRLQTAPTVRPPGLHIGHRLLIGFMLLALLAVPAGHPQAHVTLPAQSVIVQGRDPATVRALVEAAGSTVTQELGIIDAVSAQGPDRSLSALKNAPGVRAVWFDAPVRTSQTADPGTFFAPVTGYQIKRDSFDLKKVTAQDGSRDALQVSSNGRIDPGLLQLYTFSLMTMCAIGTPARLVPV